MKPPPDQSAPAPQGRARHSVRAVGNGSNTPVDNRGAQRTDAPYQTNKFMTPIGTVETLSDEPTGLPWFHTWGGVYVFVFGCFVLWVALLFTLTVIFS